MPGGSAEDLDGALSTCCPRSRRAACSAAARGCARVARSPARLLALLAFLGPGLIAANAGNDAGGIATYASVGAKYGYDLLWMMVVITVSPDRRAGDGGADGGRHRQGPRRADPRAVRRPLVAVLDRRRCWSRTSASASASSSASAPRSALAHVPKYASVPIAAAVVWLLLVRGSYKVAERIFVLMTIPFFAYPIAAILAHPHWGSVGQAIVAPHIQLNSAVPVPLHRDRRHDDHAVHAALRPVGGRRARHRRRRAERRARRGRRRARSSPTSSPASSSSRPARRCTSTATATSTAPPMRRRRSRRSPAATPRCCSRSACSARACSRRRSCPSPPPT